jgi:TP901 family phage tail tape measure protein
MGLNGATFFVRVKLQFADQAQFRSAINTGTSGLSQVTSSVNKVGTAVASTRKQFANLAGAFTGIVAAKFAAAVMIGFVKPAMQMDTAMTRLKTLTGATQAELAKMKAEAIRVSTITPYGPVEMTDALLKLRQATGDTGTAMKMLEPAASMAMASFGKINVEKSIEIFANMAKSFGLTGDSAVTAANRMFVAAKTTGTSLDMFARAFATGKLGQIKRELGSTFDETIRLFGLGARGGGQPTEVATALRNIAIRLREPAVQAGLRSLGVNVTKDGQRVPIEQMLLQLMESMKSDPSYTKGIINQIFKQRAGPMINTLVSQFMQGIVDPSDPTGQRRLTGQAMRDFIRDQMLTNTTALTDAQENYIASVEGTLEIMKEAWDLTKMILSEPLLPTISSWAQGAQDALAGFNKTLKNSPFLSSLFGTTLHTIGYSAAFIGIAAALQGVFLIGRLVVVNVFAPLTTLGTSLFPVAAANATAFGKLNVAVRAVAASSAASWFARMVGWASALTLALAGAYAMFKLFQYMQERNVKSADQFADIRQMSRTVTNNPTALEGSVGDRGRAAADAILKEDKRIKRVYGTDNQPGSAGWYAQQSNQMIANIWGEKYVRPAYKAMTGAGSSFKDSMKEGAKALTDAMELLPEKAQTIYDALVIGSKELHGIIDRLKGEGSWRPKKLNTQLFEQMQSTAAKAATGMPDSLLKRQLTGGASGGLAALNIMRQAHKEGREMTPTEYRQLVDQTMDLKVALEQLSIMTKGKGISTKQLDKFKKNIIEPMHYAQTDTSIEATRRLMRLGATGQDIEGWTQGIGYPGNYGETAVATPHSLNLAHSDARDMATFFGSHGKLPLGGMTMLPQAADESPDSSIAKMRRNNEDLLNRMMKELRSQPLQVENVGSNSGNQGNPGSGGTYPQ